MLNIFVHGRRIKSMRFLLVGSGGWLVSLGKEEPGPEARSLPLHLMLCPFCLLLPSLKRKRCHCIGKENGFFCVTAPIPGNRYILQNLLCSGASVFLILLVSSAGVGLRGRFGGCGAGRTSELRIGKPRKRKPWKPK